MQNLESSKKTPKTSVYFTFPIPPNAFQDRFPFEEFSLKCICRVNDYETIVDPTPKEVKLTRELDLKNKESQKLKAQRDTADEYAASMQKQSNKAIHNRDNSNYALKKVLVEVEKYKSRLKIAKSLIGTDKPKETVNSSLMNPIYVGLAAILAVIIFGKTFD